MIIRDILIYFAIKYRGDWNKIYQAIKNKERVDEEEIKHNLELLKCQTLTIIDKEYPLNLKNCFHPPFVIFYYGDISLLNMDIVSIVGSRECNDYAIESTKKIISDLKDTNIVICSGLAKGIDKIAHQEALKNQIKTIAVSPVGIDLCYPKENYSLYKDIKNQGLIISEYPFFTKIDKKHFASRNRIIASLCYSMICTSVKARSGTLVSVKFAIEYGKDLFVIPYPIDQNNLCNTLIKDGAYLIDNGKDLL